MSVGATGAMKASLVLVTTLLGSNEAVGLPKLPTTSYDRPPSSPEAAAGMLSRATFAWLNPTLRLGNQRPLEENDLPPLCRMDSSQTATDSFDRHFEAMRALGTASQPNAVALSLWRSFGREFAVAGVVKLLSDVCQLATPLLLRHMISLLEGGANAAQGVRATLALFAVSCLQAFSLRHYFAQLFRTGLRLRAAVVGATYRKLLRVAPTARVSSGDVTNLIGPDSQRICDLVPYLHALWFAPLQVLAALGLLYSEVGLRPLLPGLAVVLGMLLANRAIATATFRCQQVLLVARDL